MKFTSNTDKSHLVLILFPVANVDDGALSTGRLHLPQRHFTGANTAMSGKIIYTFHVYKLFSIFSFFVVCIKLLRKLCFETIAGMSKALSAIGTLISSFTWHVDTDYLHLKKTVSQTQSEPMYM